MTTIDDIYLEVQRHVWKMAPKFYETEFAPATWSQLVDEYNDWRGWHERHGKEAFVIPVSNLYMDRTIYPNREGNLAFRAWHDTLHLMHWLDFSEHSELELGSMHAAALRRRGASEDAVRAIWYDTAGQTIFNGIHGQFPDDQKAFVTECLVNTPKGAPAFHLSSIATMVAQANGSDYIDKV